MFYDIHPNKTFFNTHGNFFRNNYLDSTWYLSKIHNVKMHIFFTCSMQPVNHTPSSLWIYIRYSSWHFVWLVIKHFRVMDGFLGRSKSLVFWRVAYQKFNLNLCLLPLVCHCRPILKCWALCFIIVFRAVGSLWVSYLDFKLLGCFLFRLMSCYRYMMIQWWCYISFLLTLLWCSSIRVCILLLGGPILSLSQFLHGIS